MINKVLIRITLIATIFTINICSAYLYDYEPALVNSDLRLAAIGNLDLVAIGWDNEINAYDFGESPAGIIGDNNGKSTIYMPEAYGFTAFDEWPYEYEWDSYGLRVLGIAKFKSRFAIGGSFLKARADRTYSTPYDVLPYSNYYDNYNVKLLSAYQATPWLNVGFRGSYKKRRSSFESSHDWGYYESDKYIHEPAVLFNLSEQHWQIGLNYRLSKAGKTTTIHHFTLPVIYSIPKIALALKSAFGPVPHSDDFKKSFEGRSIYRLLLSDGSINFGVLFAYSNPLIEEDFSIWSSPGWQMNLGIGIAYKKEKFGLIGMQYKKFLLDERYYWGGSYTSHENCMSLGSEILLHRNISLRLGYVNVNIVHYSDYPTYDIITSGFGIKIPKAKLEIDFAYNSKLIRYDYHYEFESASYLDVDHLFGLSGRFIF